MPSKKQCAQCFIRLCKVHPLQDHGQASARLTSAAKDSTLDKMYDALVAPQIDKFKAGMETAETEADLMYRASLKREREKSEKRKRKDVSKDALALGTSGLNGNVVNFMNANDGDSSSSSSSDSSVDDKKREKKRRKKEKKKEKKEIKKEVRHGVRRQDCSFERPTQ